MLVLTRKVEEKLQIGPDITVTIVKVENGKVRIGISAPQAYEITRPDAKNKTKQVKSVKAHDDRATGQDADTSRAGRDARF